MNLGLVEIDIANPGIDLYMQAVAMYAYLLSGLLFIIKPLAKNKIVTNLAVGFLIIGFLPDLAAWIYSWVEMGRVPMGNMSEFASLMTVMSAGLFLGLIWKYREPSIGTFVVPLIFMTSFTSIYFYTGLNAELVPALQSHWLTWHVLLAAVGSGAFLVSAAVSVAYIIKVTFEDTDNPPKTIIVLSKMYPKLSRLFLKVAPRIASILPKASLLDTINYQSVSIGYPLYTIGALFFGSIWAQYAWGTFWGWDPKEIGALIIWIFYSAYLHARLKKGWKERKAAWMSIIGFAMVALSFFGNNFLGGNHAYG